MAARTMKKAVRTSPPAPTAPALGAVRYDPHPGLQMMHAWAESMQEKTGRSLQSWLRLIEREGPEGEAPRRAWLKAEHGLNSPTAWWLAERSVGKGSEGESPEAYLHAAAGWVEALYAGPKASLLPIHERIIEAARSLGADVKICPCRTVVQLYRSHVFGQIKPSTRTRIDLGLWLAPLVKDGQELPDRLIDTGGFAKKDRITHRIPLMFPADLDREALRWLKRAYALDA